MKKAAVAKVCLGSKTFDGLMLPNGSFAIAVSQVAEIFSLDKTIATRRVKALLGKGSPLDKIASELTSRKVNIINLAQLEKVIVELSLKGNQEAQDLIRALAGLSLTQLYCDAFGVKFEAEDRQAYLKSRLEGKLKRRELTDSIRDYCETHEVSDNYKLWAYSNVSDHLNRALFGKTSKQLKEERGVKTLELLRDQMSWKELDLIKTHELYASKLVDKQGVEPLEAIKLAIDFYQ